MATSLNAADPLYTSDIVEGTVQTQAVVDDTGDNAATLWASMIMAIFAAVFAF